MSRRLGEFGERSVSAWEPAATGSQRLMAIGTKGVANVGDDEFDHGKSWHRLVPSFRPHAAFCLDDESWRDAVAIGERLNDAGRLHHGEDDVDHRAALVLAPGQRMAPTALVYGVSDHLIRHALDRRRINVISGGELVEVGIGIIGHAETVSRFGRRCCRNGAPLGTK
jgi:hypothetical protein